jgi:hypothetical protein
MIVGAWSSGVLSHRHARHDLLFGSEVEHELPGYRLKQFPFMTERHAVAARGDGAGLEQWILQTRSLLLHRAYGFANLDRTHSSGTEISHLLDLQEVEKRVVGCSAQQARFFPSTQLAVAQAEDAKYVFSAVIHSE